MNPLSLAKEIGVPKSIVYEWRQGVREPSMENLLRLSDFFGVSLEYLTGIVKRTKTYGRTFLPTMTREEYFATSSFSHRYKPEMTGLVKALLERPEADKATLLQIQQMVADKLKDAK